MFVVGLTGGIGSGKTKVSDWFAKQGITIIDADVLARQVVKIGSPTLAQIVTAFGDWVLDATGALNRQAIREKIFHSPKDLQILEQILHPAIQQLAKQQLSQATSVYVMLVAPLLLEAKTANLVKLCQRILVVDCDEALQIQRASQRDGQTAENIVQIMAKQLTRQQRLAKADDVVENNGSLDDLYQQLTILHQQYLQFATLRNGV